jgi:hypothetical protein
MCVHTAAIIKDQMEKISAPHGLLPTIRIRDERRKEGKERKKINWKSLGASWRLLRQSTAEVNEYGNVDNHQSDIYSAMSGHFGRSTHAILAPGTKMPDGK